MPLTPLRPPAPRVQDAPRKLSTPQPPARGAANRPSSPALRAMTAGESGFDGRTRPAQLSLAGTGPSQSPATAFQGDTSKAREGREVQAASGAWPPDSVVTRAFNRTSETAEKILGSLGYTNLPPIEDPTERLTQRSNLITEALTKNPGLISQISPRDKRKFIRQVKFLERLAPRLPPPQQDAIKAAGGAVQAMSGQWPPDGNK